MDWLDGVEAHWIWLTLGLILAGLEMAVPGVYLIWLAIAAIIIGGLTSVIDLPLALQVIGFVVLSLGTAFSAKRFLRGNPIISSDPLMNQRGARMIGETAVVAQAITHGSGRVHFGDGEWIAHGADVAAGEYVRITGTQGAVLLVEPLAPGAGLD